MTQPKLYMLSLSQRLVLRKTLSELFSDCPDAVAFRNRLIAIIGERGLDSLRDAHLALGEGAPPKGPT